MNKENNGRYFVAAGYDAVARKKIKELEKAVFGGTEMVEKVVLVESKVCTGYTNEPEGLVRSLPTPTSLVLEAGRTYKIVIDGTDVYSGVARELQTPSPVIAIGNTALDSTSLGSYSEDTGENFLVYVATINGMTGIRIAIYNPEKYSYGDHTVNVKISTMEEKPSGSGGSGGGSNVDIVVATVTVDYDSPDEYGGYPATYDIPFAELDTAIRSGKVVYARVVGYANGIYNAPILIPMQTFDIDSGNIEGIHFQHVTMFINDVEDGIVTNVGCWHNAVYIYPDRTAYYAYSEYELAPVTR